MYSILCAQIYRNVVVEFSCLTKSNGIEFRPLATSIRLPIAVTTGRNSVPILLQHIVVAVAVAVAAATVTSASGSADVSTPT
ncbi:hypothetical protein V1477_005939 [Vespula maculifrons]|uniref:Uncharacterized protein n=1 Tax=Vespula maculifrons TaxID=7453 RepID=A0ABD2CKZ8_VESMC